MVDSPVRHVDADGSIYAAEIVPPETDSYGAKYRVDLVRASVDAYGLEREQRLALAEYTSWGEAEEHLYEVEDRLAEGGLAGLGEAAQGIVDSPYGDDVRYLALLMPPGDDPNAEVEANVVALKADDIAFAPFAAGRRGEIEMLVNQVEAAQAREGIPAMLDTAHEIAVQQRLMAPDRPLFGGADEPDLPADLPFTFGEGMQPFDRDGVAAVHHVDGGGAAHWFAVVENPKPEAEPYELRYFRAVELDDGALESDSYPVMALPDDDPGSAWPLPGLEMYLRKGDVYMAQLFAHDVADVYGQAFPDPLDLPALNPQPEYYFGYGIGPSNSPSLESVKTWMDGAERRFDTFTIAEYGTWEEARTDERQLEETLETSGLEAALNRAERMAMAGGYLDPNRDDPRVFFEDDAPPDMFMTARQRELNIPSYGLGAVSANGESFLDVVKSWGEDGHQRLVIPQPDWETAQANADVAGELLEKGRLQEAMRLVELAGIDAGVIDPDRDDPRLFTQGPPDPFTTIRQAELAQETEIALNDDFDTEAFDENTPGYPALYREFAEAAERERGATAAIEGAAWFEATFAKSDTELLHPIDDTVNYAVVVQDADPWTLELAVEKYWKEPGGYIGVDSLTLHTYDPETGREQAEQEREALLEVYDERRLEGMMHKAELTAMQNDWLDKDRADVRLFTQGPPDPFETLAQQLAGEINPYWNTDDEPFDAPETAVENPYRHPETLPDISEMDTEPYTPVTLDEDKDAALPGEVENPYWRLETLPVNDPKGKPLGHALHIVVYPGLEHDPDQVGAPEIPEDEPFRMLEMAHFETTEEANRFGKEFRGYLMPGFMDGPDLAEEVARLEGYPVTWKTLEGKELEDYRNLNLTLTRGSSDWHPYNPNAERDARIEAEGLYLDPIRQFTTFDEDVDDSKVESVGPDFDL